MIKPFITLLMFVLITAGVLITTTSAIEAGPGKYYHNKCGSNSMYPVLTCNDSFTIERIPDKYNISIGTIVMYRKPAYVRNGMFAPFIIHRIVGVVRGYETICPLPRYCLRFRRDYYVTKGDNNPTKDYWRVSPMSVKFVVTKVNGVSRQS